MRNTIENLAKAVFDSIVDLNSKNFEAARNCYLWQIRQFVSEQGYEKSFESFNQENS